MKIRKPFEPSEGVAFVTEGETMTKQSHQDECDINTIMKQFAKTGLVRHTAAHQGRYGDFIGAPEYQEACNRVLEARQMFESLPAGVRKRFQNDPAEFLAFVHDPANEEELVKMGLAKARKEALDAPEPAPEPDGVVEPETA